MTTPERRRVLYSRVFNVMARHQITVPLDVRKLCRDMGVELVTLMDIVEDTGLTEREVFAIWGNTDGAVHMHNGKYRIAYNNTSPLGRWRFTVCEELAHMIIGHTEDPRFNIFRQEYDADTYAQYEEEARLGAGLLICPPTFFYTFERFMTPENTAKICNITLDCAKTRCAVYDKYRDEIRSSVVYGFMKIPRATVDMWQYQRKWVAEQRKAKSEFSREFVS